MNLNTKSDLEDCSNKPVSLYIVCGTRRSGTTLLTAILSSDNNANLLGQEAQLLTRLMNNYRWAMDNYQHFGTSFFASPQALFEFYQKTLQDLVDRMAAFASPKGVLVLKNPELSMVISDLADIFPEAHLLAIVRDPRDQICSEFEVGKRRKAAGVFDAAFESRDVEVLAKSYLHYMSGIMKLKNSQTERLHIIRYEDLILAPTDTLAELQKMTGLKFEFDYQGNWSKISDNASLHEGFSQSDLYGGPINDSSLGRYQHELSDDEVARIEKLCGHIMQEFAYNLTTRYEAS